MPDSLNLLSVRIETSNLLLVPISSRYREDIFREFTAEIATHMFPQPRPDISATDKFIEDSLKELAANKDLQIVILDKSTGEFMGCGGLHNVDAKVPEFGVWLKKAAHGKKYGREAMQALKDWADKNIDYEYLVYPVATDNIPSRKIPESMGGKVFREYEKTSLDGKLMRIAEYRIFPL